MNNLVRLLVVIFVLTLLGVLIRLDLDHHGIRSGLAPQPILSVVTLIVGFVVLSWQIDRQYENALEANRRQAQDRLKLEMDRAGVAQTVAMKVTGHKTPSMWRRYRITSTDEVRDALARTQTAIRAQREEAGNVVELRPAADGAKA